MCDVNERFDMRLDSVSHRTKFVIVPQGWRKRENHKRGNRRKREKMVGHCEQFQMISRGGFIWGSS